MRIFTLHLKPDAMVVFLRPVHRPKMWILFDTSVKSQVFQDYPSKANFGSVLNVFGVVFRGLGTVFEAFAGRCEGI